MRILALETTETAGSVAALCDDHLLAQLEMPAGSRSAQSLAPAVRTLWRQVGWSSGDVQLVAVATGPGSFTGLRVGVATAKVLAYALGAEVLGVDALEVVASAATADVDSLWTAIDAQRGDVVARLFHRDAEGWLRPAGPQQLLDCDQWLAGLPAGSALSGPVFHKWAARVPAHLSLLPAARWNPTAAAVGRLAARDYAAGRRDDLWKLAPHYSRRAAAEEKWDLKQASR